jgi:hypothetical protein
MLELWQASLTSRPWLSIQQIYCSALLHHCFLLIYIFVSLPATRITYDIPQARQGSPSWETSLIFLPTLRGSRMSALVEIMVSQILAIMLSYHLSLFPQGLT